MHDNLGSRPSTNEGIDISPSVKQIRAVRAVETDRIVHRDLASVLLLNADLVRLRMAAPFESRALAVATSPDIAPRALMRTTSNLSDPRIYHRRSVISKLPEIKRRLQVQQPAFAHPLTTSPRITTTSPKRDVEQRNDESGLLPQVREVPIPQIGDDEVLLKGEACGVCGTDQHVHEGEFIAAFPLIPGHEIVGEIADLGKNVSGFTRGDRVVGDPSVLCGSCFYCRRGQALLCENYKGVGVSLPGGFAEYVTMDAKKVYKIHNLSDEEATLVEPAACAVHGMDKLNAPVGVEALIIGSGPTGLILAQLLKLNGATRVVVAANKGIKVDIAKQLETADEYVELDREDPSPQWEELKKNNPYGFDVVVEATGSEKIANEAINYVRRGGTLMVYGVYSNDALVHWSPSKIFVDEIRIIGSFAQTFCFPRAIAYLDSGKVRVKGLVTDVYPVGDFDKVLEKMRSKTAVKIAVKP
ncbi:hypothetical protein NUW54_g2080 [Trametes sanguinea]|uniref:Uncharacterized protein n=1 Tax=Trametes sanguinea TaxID=158606 RepID=A0ACC1Q4J0_9APHY|nr:hypothetical protein NUW54_g2080 [Trametes sanguinea]